MRNRDFGLSGMLAVLGAAFLLLFGLVAYTAGPTTVAAFGPEKFVRGTGAPQRFDRSFALPPGADGRCTLAVQNGDSDKTRVTSATLALNGAVAVGPAEFQKPVPRIEKTVALKPQNALTVELASKPGSFLVVSITCPSPVAALTGIEVSPDSITFTALNQSQALTVTGLYDDGSRKDLTSSVWVKTFLVTGGSSAQVDATGVVTALDAGYSRITVQFDEFAATVDVSTQIAPVAPPQNRQNAVAALLPPDESGLRVTWNPRNGTVESLLNPGGRLTDESADDPAVIAERFILEHPQVFGLSDLSAFELARRYRTENNGVTHLAYRQMHDGIPLDQAGLRFHVDASGRLLYFAGDYEPQPSFPASTPSVSAAQAVATVAARLAPTMAYTPVSVSGPDGPEQSTAFEAGPFGEGPYATLTWLTLSDGARLAWAVDFSGGGRYVTAYVDAHGGELLYTPDRIYGAVPSIPGKALMKFTYTRNDQPSDVVFKGEWFGPPLTTTGSYESTGPYALVSVLKAPGADPKPNSLNFFSFGATLPPYVYQISTAADYNQNFNWRADTYWIPENAEPGAYDNQKFSTAHVFYWINYLHDYFLELGFSNAIGNFEAGYHGQGSFAENTGMLAYVRNSKSAGLGCNSNNACFLPAFVGQGAKRTIPIILFGFNADFSLDPQVIIHEYTHGVAQVTIGDDKKFEIFDPFQARAVTEAVSDFFAASLTNNPVLIEWMPFYPAGLRMAPLTTDQYHYRHEDFYQEGADALRDVIGREISPYAASLAYSSSLWEIREAFLGEYGQAEGKQRAEQLVFDALTFMKSAPSMVNARDAVLAAQDADECSAIEQTIWEAFAKRGLGDDAISKGARSDDPTPGYKLPLNYQEKPLLEKYVLEGNRVRLKGNYLTEKAKVTANDQPVPSSFVSCKELNVTLSSAPTTESTEICVEKTLLDNTTVKNCISVSPASWAIGASASIWGGPVDEEGTTIDPGYRSFDSRPVEVGQSSVQLSFADPAGGSRVDVRGSLPTPVGQQFRAASMTVMHFEGENITAKRPADNLEPRAIDSSGTVRFQEAITLYGIERPNGTVDTTGSLTCHLEITGTADHGPISPAWVGFSGGFNSEFRVALVPPGASLTSPELLINRCDADDCDLSPLAGIDQSEEFLYMNLNVTSQNFQAPAQGTLVLYGRGQVGGFLEPANNVAFQSNATADFQLVCNAAEGKLIYQK